MFFFYLVAAIAGANPQAQAICYNAPKHVESEVKFM